MKLKILAYSMILLAGLLAILPAAPVSADAINYSNIIDDGVFDDTTTMSAAQIDAFFNRFPNSCISTNRGFKAPDPTGYSPAGSSNPGFHFGSNVSAGTVIYHAAQAFELNPQVLIATLQKEQSLVTGSAGCYPNTPNSGVTYRCALYGGSTMYNCTHACPYNGGCIPIAVGYGCPGACNAAQEGFSNQIIRASWRLSFDRHRSEGLADWYISKPNWDSSDDAQLCYNGPMTQGTYRICPSGSASYYDGYTTIDGQPLHIDNGATAALYHYTPFKHGQDLFYTNFTNWFGSTHGNLMKTSTSNTVYLVTSANKYPVDSLTMLNALYPLSAVRTTSSAYLDGKTTMPTLKRLIKSASSSSLYFFDAGIKLPFTSCNQVTDYGMSCSDAAVLDQPQIDRFVSGPSMTNVMNTRSGQTFAVSAGKKLEAFDQTSLTNAGYTSAANTLSASVLDYLPYGAPLMRDGVLLKDRKSTTEYLYSGSTAYTLPVGLQANSSLASIASGALDPQSISQLTRQSFNGYFQDSQRQYLLTAQGKAVISTPTDWSSQYVTLSSALLSQIKTAPAVIDSRYFYQSDNGSKSLYVVRAITKAPIPSWEDVTLLNALSSQPVVVKLPSYYVNSLPTIRLQYGPTRLVKSAASRTVFMIDGIDHKITLASFLPVSATGLSSQVLTLPDGILKDYTTEAGYGSQFISCTNNHYLASQGSLHLVSSTVQQDYGFTDGLFVNYQTTTCNKMKKGSDLTQHYVKPTNGKTIYYVSGGQKHPFNSYTSYQSHGGTSSNTISLEPETIDQIPTGSSL